MRALGVVSAILDMYRALRVVGAILDRYEGSGDGGCYTRRVRAQGAIGAI